MIEYVDQVLSGQVLAGQKIKWACERFKRDLRRSKDDSFPVLLRRRQSGTGG